MTASIRSVPAGLAVVSALALALPASATSFYELVPDHRGNSGQHRLWIGQGDSHFGPWAKWDFEDVTLVVHDDGDATVSGTMVRLDDLREYPDLVLDWELHIELGDAVFAGGGIEWHELSMAITPPDTLPYANDVPRDDWLGFRGNGGGHDYVAAFRIDEGGGEFTARYLYDGPDSSLRKIGDTRAIAHAGEGPGPAEDPGPVGSVPEPSAALLFAAGWALVGTTARRTRSG